MRDAGDHGSATRVCLRPSADFSRLSANSSGASSARIAHSRRRERHSGPGVCRLRRKSGYTALAWRPRRRHSAGLFSYQPASYSQARIVVFGATTIAKRALPFRLGCRSLSEPELLAAFRSTTLLCTISTVIRFTFTGPNIAHSGFSRSRSVCALLVRHALR